jgi:uncharacterized protein YlxW (UPF0749 family)
MMSTILPSARGKSWIFQVTALCIVLGALLGLSLKTYKKALKTDYPSRPYALQQAYREIKKANEDMQSQIADYKKQCDDLTDKLASRESGAGLLAKTLDEQRLLAGTSAAHGPGIVVTLVDSPKLNPAETDPYVIEQFMVHDKNLLEIVNELFANGAEAICVNNERWISTSYIRCVGITVMINTRRISQPFTIKAIGDPAALQDAVMHQGGPADDLILLEMITVKKENDIVVPAYTGIMRFELGKRVEEPSNRD